MNLRLCDAADVFVLVLAQTFLVLTHHTSLYRFEQLRKYTTHVIIDYVTSG